MKKNVLLVLVSLRKESAVKVQQILTEWGCFIKTRLGLHEGVLEDCTESGLLFLELVGDETKHQELARKLNLLKNVEAKLVTLSVE
jgi:hypothetical protein